MVASWDAWTQAKRTAVEYLAVFIATIGFVFGCIGLLVGMLAMASAYNAHEQAEVYSIYVRNLHSDLIASGFEPPPLPEERE